MKAMHFFLVLFLSVGLNSAFAGNGGKTSPTSANFKNADKQTDKTEKAAFKQHLKEERTECKHHPHTVACNDLKERQRIEKRQFKAGERAEEWAQQSNFKGVTHRSK